MDPPPSSSSYPCDLTIVLLCSGRGADAQSYRPNLDESQWWGRRDALVRCVAASLFGPRSGGGGGGGTAAATTELILLHDGDGSSLRMASPPLGGSPSHAPPPSGTGGGSSIDVPTERNVVSAWRRAALASASASASASGSRLGAGAGGGGRPTFALSSDPGPPPGVTCRRMAESISIARKGTASSSSGGAGIEAARMGAGAGADAMSSNSLPEDFGDGYFGEVDDDEGDVADLRSKREVLAHVQRRCPLDFLRSHRLNSGTDVILRKTNRARLVRVWEEWCRSGRQSKSKKPCDDRQGAGGKSSAGRKRRREEGGGHRGRGRGGGGRRDDGGGIGSDEIELIFRSILLEGESRGRNVAPGKDDDEDPSFATDSRPPRVMAAYLHESCGSELPCFFGGGGMGDCDGHENANGDAPVDDKPKNDAPLRLCLFLGAVRDMTDDENRALATACSALRVPLVGFRLGPVPEFTSKILTVVGYHNSRGVLGPAVIRLWRERGSSLRDGTAAKLPPAAEATTAERRRGRRRLHVVCNVPMRSEALTSDLSSRTRLLWCIVRVCVCTLWRSRLASSAAASAARSDVTDGKRATASAAFIDNRDSGPYRDHSYGAGVDGQNESLENVLSLIFCDGVVVNLEQDELVTSLATKHQAAPSEYQILAALCQKRDEVVAQKSRRDESSRDSKSRSITVKNACRRLAESTLKKWNESCTGSVPFACCLRVFGNMQSEKNCRYRALTDLVYSEQGSDQFAEADAAPGGLVFVLMHLRTDSRDYAADDSFGREGERSDLSCEIDDALTSAFNGLPIFDQEVVSSDAQDAEAVIVAMLQHFDYQDRLFPCLKRMCSMSGAQELQGTDSSRRRDTREKKKQKLKKRKVKKKRSKKE